MLQMTVIWMSADTSSYGHVLSGKTTPTLLSKYGRHKLADDGTNFAQGQAIAMPSMIKG